MHTLKTSKARENILGKIRKALNEESTPMPFPETEKNAKKEFYSKYEHSPEEAFAENFIALGGKFVFCADEKEAIAHITELHDNRNWQNVLCAEPSFTSQFENNNLNIVRSAHLMEDGADACITTCEALIARTGSAIISSMQNLGRSSTVFYPTHIMIAYANQVVPDIQQGIDLVKKKYDGKLPSMINLNTGPSRTADIEKTLVVGVHGPGEVFCFFINK